MLDDKNLLIKKFRLRRAGAKGRSIEITIPKAAIHREARRLGLKEGEAVEKLLGVWKYNHFPGLHLTFEIKTKNEEGS